MNLLRRWTLAAALAGLARTADAAESAPRPHIVVIVADDMGWRDAGFQGARQTRTPALDRLAASGVVLRAHYVQPVCSPTRAALMTGRLATRTGIYTVIRPGETWGLPLGERTLAQTLREAGYSTAITGKWHLGEFEEAYRPTRRGFDHQYGLWFGAIDYHTHMRDNVRDWHRDDQPCADEGYSTHLIAREAVRLIENRPKEKPLFLYVPFNAVHAPHQVPARYTEPFDSLNGVRRTYAGMLAAMDEAVGQIRDALEKAGMLENTFLMFTSDNGGPSPGKVTDNGPLRAGKGTLYEGGVRACAFATWPGHLPAGQVREQAVQVTDWFPTLCRVAGAALPAGVELDGRDVMPVLVDGAPSPHEALLLVGSSPEKAAIRVGDWKLLRGADETDDEDAPAGKAGGGKRRRSAASDALYNLARDIGESHDLSAEQPEKVRELREQLERLLKGAVAPGRPAH